MARNAGRSALHTATTLREPGSSASLPSRKLPRLDERFELGRQLGAGSFGVVYEAFDRDRGARVALKHSMHRGMPACFRDELALVGAIHHPNLVELHDRFELDDEHLLSMELVRGAHVLHHLAVEATATLGDDDESGVRARASAEPREVAAVMLQIARGLSALHSAERLHRDIKPSNLLVERATGRAVVIDFGLVVTFAEAAIPVRNVAGTPHYMSPEQLLGHPLTPASDWYAFGIVLFEALTGRRPFDGETADDIVVAKTAPAPPAPSSLVRLPRVLDELCAQLLRPRACDRPRADEIVAVLASVAAQ